MASEKELVMNPANEIVNAVKLAGDVVVLPGTSLLLQGKVPQGGAHAILGVLAWRMLPRIAGPIGWVLLAANAYAKSTSGHYLHDYLCGLLRGLGHPHHTAVENPAVAEEPKIDPVPSDPDDLARIEGIGPKIAGVLQDRGIKTFDQLAKTSVEQLRQILREVHLRMIDPSTWPDQAKLAAAGQWKALDTLQKQLIVGRQE